MYANFFGLKQEPFSIAPDPRYLFMSERHREALAHLLYGTGGGGGFVVLTGEIGAGKTTVCRCFLEQIPRRCNVAYIFNPKLTVTELLKSVCDEFRIPYRQSESPLTVKDYLDPLNEFLLKTHAVGLNNILIIDEAQHLSAEVLEQLRLLTNLETNERKLLQIILIGQPELRDLLARPELEQLAQRVIARFHLEALSEVETSRYIRHRLAIGGLTSARPFDRKARQRIHQLSRGVPRRINLLCDRALLGAYAAGKTVVDLETVEQAATEVFANVTATAEAPSSSPAQPAKRFGRAGAMLALGLLAGLGVASVLHGGLPSQGSHSPSPPSASASSASAVLPASRVATAPGTGSSQAATAVAAPFSLASASASAPVPLSEWKPVVDDENELWRDLASLWKLAPGAQGSVCKGLSSQPVQCFKGVGTLAMVRQLGRPVILSLHDDKSRVRYALLTGLDEQTATLQGRGGASQGVPLIALAQRWRGEYATFWRAPEGYKGAVAQGQSGPVVDALAEQLARAKGDAPPAPLAVFDAAFKSNVIAFQVAHGLQPDGVAGPTTFMQLNRALGVDEPRLLTGSAKN